MLESQELRGSGWDGLVAVIRASHHAHPPLPDGQIDPDHCTRCREKAAELVAERQAEAERERAAARGNLHIAHPPPADRLDPDHCQLCAEKADHLAELEEARHRDRHLDHRRWEADLRRRSA